MQNTSLTQNHIQFEGLSEVYDNARPNPPPFLREALAQLVGVDLRHYPLAKSLLLSESSPLPDQKADEKVANTTQHADLPPLSIVDIGCGSGMSTFYWDGFAKDVVGIDPGDGTYVPQDAQFKFSLCRAGQQFANFFL